MKKLLLLALILAMILSLSACQNREAPDNISSTASSNASSSESVSSSSEEPPESKPEENAETAIFQLTNDEAIRKAIKVGDKLGEWTLSELIIDYDKAQKIHMLEANFSGEVALKGKITRNALVEVGYDFTVSDEDIAKMVQYVPPEAVNDNSSELQANMMFMLNIPEGLEDSPKLEFDEELPCTITISEYRYIFAYMMAPSSATVTKIDIENK